MASTPGSDAHRLVLPKAMAGGRTRRLWIWGLLAVVAVAGAIAAKTWIGRGPAGATWRTLPVEKRTVVVVVEAGGSLDVMSRVEIAAPAGAALEEILVEPGALVKKDQILARLDARSSKGALALARATLAVTAGHVAEAQAALRASEDARRRAEGLKERGLASDGELVAARTGEERASAAVAVARAEQVRAAESLASAEREQGLRTIRSPSEGVVLTAPRWVGAVAAPERGPLFVIGNPVDVLRLEVGVAEADIGAIRPKQVARFSVPAFPGREFEAEVEQVRIEAAKKDGVVTFPVVLRAPNADRVLFPGMTASARIQVAEAKDVLTVREAALRFTPEGAPAAAPRTRVWRTVDGRALEPVKVVVGASDGAYTEVRPEGADLSEGAFVVVGVLSGDAAAVPGISLGGKKP